MIAGVEKMLDIPKTCWFFVNVAVAVTVAKILEIPRIITVFFLGIAAAVAAKLMEIIRTIADFFFGDCRYDRPRFWKMQESFRFSSWRLLLRLQL